MGESANCVFCDIIAGKEPANIRYLDDDLIVFDNALKWVPVMLLVVPKRHMTQKEMWRSMDRVGEVAVSMGEEHCPNGFRILSNFGHEGMQSQTHAHVHVIGGAQLGRYA